MTRWPVGLCSGLVRGGFRVVRFDNRDSGLSTHFDQLGLPRRGLPPPYTLDDLAGDVVDLLTVLGIEQAHVVGVSMGGAVAQQIAISHPHRVRSLISIMSTSGGAELPPCSERVRALFAASPRAYAGVVETREARVVALMTSAEAGRSPRYPVSDIALRRRVDLEVDGGFTLAGRARQAAALSSAGDRRVGLSAITVPTMIIHGDADELFPLAHAADLVATIPRARMTVVAGLGHDLPDGAAPTLAATIVNELNRVECAEKFHG